MRRLRRLPKRKTVVRKDVKVRRLSVEIRAELHQGLREASARTDESIREIVERALSRELEPPKR